MLHILFLSSLVFPYSSTYGSKEVIYQIHNNDTGMYYCLTNSSYGLTWIDKTNTLNEISKIQPNLTYVSNEYIMDEYEIKTFDTTLILDYRWEEMETIVTNQAIKKVDDSSAFSYFTLPFSLRSEEKAEIHLCSDNVTSSNCYRLIFGISNGSGTEIQRCLNGNCGNETLSVDYVGNSSQIVSLHYWSHFLIKRFSINRIELKKCNGESLFTLFDNEPIEINYVFFGNQQNISFWKIHKTTAYQLSTRELRKKEFLRHLPVIDNSMCISVFINSPCKFITLTMTSSENGEILKKEQFRRTIFSHEYYWIDIKFYCDNINVNKTNIHISPSCGSPISFSKLRFCSINEFRNISSKKPLSCQLITQHESMDWWDSTTNQKYSNGCPNNYTSQHSVSDYWLNQAESCGNSVIYNNGNSFCLVRKDCSNRINDALVFPMKEISIFIMVNLTILIVIFSILLVCFRKRDAHHNLHYHSIKTRYKEVSGNFEKKIKS